jgi:hypothetical protein
LVVTLTAHVAVDMAVTVASKAAYRLDRHVWERV